ncbi:MAG: hypothetical protein AAGD25_23800 [Cyanobacteria bacterium P01_F01_bin.150]
MPKLNCFVIVLGAIAPIGIAVMVSAAIAQAAPQPVLVSKSLERLPEYYDPSYYEEPDSDDTASNGASVIAPGLDPVPVADALQNLSASFNLSLSQENNAFDADAPMLRRQYITHMVTVYDALNTQFFDQSAQIGEDIDNECFILRMTLEYLTGRVERLQEDMERITHTSMPLSSSTQLMANASFSFLKNAEEAIPEDAPAKLAETNPDYYAYWFYTLEPKLIGTILPNHQQPLTQGDFVSYLSPTLNGVNAILTSYLDNRVQNYQEEIDWEKLRFNAIFDRIARIRGQLETLANVEQLSLSMPQPQNKLAQASTDKFTDTLVKPSGHNLDPRATLFPEWPNATEPELFAQSYPIENFPDVPSSDPLYESLWRAVNAHGIWFSPPNNYMRSPIIEDVGNIYPDEILTVGDFAYYQRQWVGRTLELVAHGAPISYLPPGCHFDQETETMEDTLLEMETELQQLIDER